MLDVLFLNVGYTYYL